MALRDYSNLSFVPEPGVPEEDHPPPSGTGVRMRPRNAHDSAIRQLLLPSAIEDTPPPWAAPWPRGGNNANWSRWSTSNRVQRRVDHAVDDDSKEELQLEKCQTVEEMSVTLYNMLASRRLPNFCQGVQLDQDGGLDRLGELWTWQKHVWCLFLFGSVFFNVFLLVSLNWQVGQSFMLNYMQRYGSRPGELMRNIDDALRSVFLHEVVNTTQLDTKVVQASLHAEDKQDLFEHIHDPGARIFIATLASVIAILEMSGVAHFLVVGVQRLYIFASGTTEFKAYRSLDAFFHETLPTLSTFSMIQLFGLVHPSLLYSNYVNMVSESSCSHSSGGVAAITLWFVVTRLVCAFLAAAAFSLKMLAVTFRLLNSEISLLMRGAAVLALMNNCVGCVLIENLLQERLFLFIFGRTDATYQDVELAYRNVYRCRLAKEIWSRYWKDGQYLQAISLLATFDHYDMQVLLIHDPTHHNGGPGVQ